MKFDKIKDNFIVGLILKVVLALILIKFLGVAGGLLGFFGVMLCIMLIMMLINGIRRWEEMKTLAKFNWDWNLTVWRKIYIKLGLLKEGDVSIWDNLRKKLKKK